MYESFFECRQRPFLAAPQSDRYYPGRANEAARIAIERCLDRAEGVAMLVGPAGTGKTLAARMTAERFRDRFAVVSMAAGGLSTRRNFYQAVAYELGMPYRNVDEGELRLAILDRLTTADSAGMVFIVDDAHSLPPRLLEEIRTLADVARAGQPRVRMLLVGGSTLEDRLAMPRLSPLEQRVTTRCYLEAFDRNDTLGYLRSQIVAAGGDPTRIFTEAALEAVFRATDGIPRLINQTCDHALVLAFAGGVKPVDVAGIEEAWADLQQLPTPWSREKGYSGVADLPQPAAPSSIANPVYAPQSPAASARTPEARTELAAVPPASSTVRPSTTLAAEAAPPSFDDVIEFVSSLPDSTIAAVDTTLEVLETQLTEWEEEFAPPAKREPEVELVVEARPNDPFCEDFVEEEIVADRYAEKDGLRTAPRVPAFAADAQMLSALLDVRRDLAAAPTLRVAAATTTPIAESAATCEFGSQDSTVIGGDAIAAARTTSNAPISESVDFVPSTAPPAKPASPIRELPSRTAARAVASTAHDEPWIATTPHARFEKQVDPVEPQDLIIVARRSSGDADMIILEDDPALPGAPAPEATVVRKQDYRHMFARLRRGS